MTETKTNSALPALVQQFEYQMASADDYRLKAGKLLLEMRQRVEAGEAGDVTWWQWYALNIKRSRKDGEKLLALVCASDPTAAAAAERDKARDRMRRHREAPRERSREDEPGGRGRAAMR